MKDINELQNKYQALYDFDGVTKESLDKIENELQIKLPNNFREISGFYSGGIVGGIDIHSFQFSEPTNFIRETIRIREAAGLPNRFVVIAEQTESIIVMDTEKTPSIIWLDSVEINKLEQQDFISKPDVWEDFSDFFHQILEDEEEERIY